MPYDGTSVLEFLTNTHETALLSDREKHLIGLAVTMTRGCQVCTRGRIEKARAAGIDGDTLNALAAVVASVNAGVAAATAREAFRQAAPRRRPDHAAIPARRRPAGEKWASRPVLNGSYNRIGFVEVTRENRTMRTVGQPFPEFSSKSCVGPDLGSLSEVNSGTIRGQWAVFVFYPKDFTFVCPTELVEFNNNLQAFQERGAVVFGGSTDNEYCHAAWCESHPQLKGLKYPLLAANKLANELGILDEVEYACQRATFIVDPDGIIQWAGVYNTRVGRSTAEVLRVLDALQSDELTPCNWQKGDAFVKG